MGRTCSWRAFVHREASSIEIRGSCWSPITPPAWWSTPTILTIKVHTFVNVPRLQRSGGGVLLQVCVWGGNRRKIGNKDSEFILAVSISWLDSYRLAWSGSCSAMSSAWAWFPARLSEMLNYRRERTRDSFRRHQLHTHTVERCVDIDR